MSADAGIRLPFDTIPAPGPWRAQGACLGADTELFFPGRGEPLEAARRVCGSCPVLAACRDYAVPVSELKGVWGGLSEVERRRLRTKRAEPATTTRAPAHPARRSAGSMRAGLYATLASLATSPGRWAQVARYAQVEEAEATVAALRDGRLITPRGRWCFEARPVPGGSGLFARFESSRTASRSSRGIAS